MRQCSWPRRLAFTLIELMIVISVISVLLSLAAPVLGRARTAARTAQCGNNLRNLGAAWQIYADDYRDYCMPMAWYAASPTLYWWGTNGSPSDYSAGLLAPYVETEAGLDNVFDCPEQPWGSYVPQGVAQGPTTTYGYNGMYLCPPASGWYWGPSAPRWLTIGEIQGPSLLFVLADALADFGWGSMPRNCCLLDGPQYPSGSWPQNPYPTQCFRHDGRTCVVFADGHTDAIHRVKGHLTSKAFPIGYVGADAAPHYVPDWRSKRQ